MQSLKTRVNFHVMCIKHSMCLQLAWIFGLILILQWPPKQQAVICYLWEKIGSQMSIIGGHVLDEIQALNIHQAYK